MFLFQRTSLSRVLCEIERVTLKVIVIGVVPLMVHNCRLKAAIWWRYEELKSPGSTISTRIIGWIYTRGLDAQFRRLYPDSFHS